jgi:hypothetical protein
MGIMPTAQMAITPTAPMGIMLTSMHKLLRVAKQKNLS